MHPYREVVAKSGKNFETDFSLGNRPLWSEIDENDLLHRRPWSNCILRDRMKGVIALHYFHLTENGNKLTRQKRLVF